MVMMPPLSASGEFLDGLRYLLRQLQWWRSRVTREEQEKCSSLPPKAHLEREI